jgi:hypothetical protein
VDDTMSDLSLEEFLQIAGVQIDDLNAQASAPQPKTLSLVNYNNLLKTLQEKFPTSSFDIKARRSRQQKESALPAQIRRGENSIRAWKRELGSISTHKAADLAVEAAEVEMRLNDRLGNSGARSVDAANPFRRHKRQRMLDDEQPPDNVQQDAEVDEQLR